MKKEFVVEPACASMRLDLFLKKQTGLSRQQIQKSIKKGHCRIDGHNESSPDKKLVPGQKIEFFGEEISACPVKEEDFTDILWQDEYLAVCNKPGNLVVHPCPSCQKNTLLQQLLTRFPQLEKIGGLRPGIVHRLDKETSGLLIIALTGECEAALADMFSRHEINKQYLCLCQGRILESGEIDEPLGRHPESKIKMAVLDEKKGGRPAKTVWNRLAYFPEGDFSLVAVRIFSGRTHQIRVHFQHLGHPLLGDKTYAPRRIAEKAPRQMLHAFRLVFEHPILHTPLHLAKLPPADFMETILENTRQTPLVIITGNPGSGKSTFSKKLTAHDLPYISADRIIEELYKGDTPLTEWLKRNARLDFEEPGGEVDREKLLKIFRENPHLKKEFENYAHSLVYEEIKKFWTNADKNGSVAAVAEIPLYFESMGQARLAGVPKFVIGVHCPDEERTKRLRTTRNWSDDKIALIQGWQWPEDKKMAACNLIVDNSGTEDDLNRETERMLELIMEFEERRRTEMTGCINGIYQSLLSSNCQ